MDMYDGRTYLIIDKSAIRRKRVFDGVLKTSRRRVANYECGKVNAAASELHSLGRTYLIIDKSAIRRNISAAAYKLGKDVKIMCLVKADIAIWRRRDQNAVFDNMYVAVGALRHPVASVENSLVSAAFHCI